MPATTNQINSARAKIQARADAEGSNGAKYTFGSPDTVIDLGERLGKVFGGRSWESGGGIGPMEILLRGLLDSMIDVVLWDLEPVGTIKMFYGGAPSIPYGWSICDGSNGTPDLRDKFILGGSYSGGSGGSDTTSQPTPNVTGACTNNETTASGIGDFVANDNHTHTMPHTHTHTPPYYRLIFIMKTSL